MTRGIDRGLLRSTCWRLMRVRRLPLV